MLCIYRGSNIMEACSMCLVDRYRLCCVDCRLNTQNIFLAKYLMLWQRPRKRLFLIIVDLILELHGLQR